MLIDTSLNNSRQLVEKILTINKKKVLSMLIKKSFTNFNKK